MTLWKSVFQILFDHRDMGSAIKYNIIMKATLYRKEELWR